MNFVITFLGFYVFSSGSENTETLKLKIYKKKILPRLGHNYALQFVVLVPTNISIFGNLAAVEGTNVTLTCNFINANPSVDNVTFFADGQPKLPSMVRFFL